MSDWLRLQRKDFATGWFGIPGGPISSSTLVHVIKRGGGGQPFCGSRVGPEQRFQWCSAGINFAFVECKRCQSKIAKVREALEVLNEKTDEL